MAKVPEFKSIISPHRRIHVQQGYQWGQSAGTDYWLNFNSGFDILAAAATTIGEQLAENGWVATSLVNTAPSAADFRGNVFTRNVSAGAAFGNRGINGKWATIGVPAHALTNASADLLTSPTMFGDAAHSWQAARLMGVNRLPNLLIAEFFGSMSVSSATEPRSGWGFMKAAGTAGVQADQYAFISAGATNFLCAGNSATQQTGPLLDQAWHLWKIVIQFNDASGPNIYAFMDGQIFSVTAGVGLAGTFPLFWSLHALTTNRPLLGLTHIFYDWT